MPLSRRAFLLASAGLTIGCTKKTTVEKDSLHSRENIRVHVIQKAFNHHCLKTLDAENKCLNAIKEDKKFGVQDRLYLVEQIGNKVYWRIRYTIEGHRKSRNDVPFGSLYPKDCFMDDTIAHIMQSSKTLTIEQKRSLLDKGALEK